MNVERTKILQKPMVEVFKTLNPQNPSHLRDFVTESKLNTI